MRKSSPRFKSGNLAISRDGRHLSSLAPTHPPQIINAQTLEIVSTASDLEHSNIATWSAAESSVLIGTEAGELSLCDLSGRRSMLMPSRYPANISEMMYSKTGRYLAIETADGNTHIYETDRNRELVTLEGKVRKFSHDEKQVCIRGADRVSVYGFVQAPSFTSIRQSVRSAVFSPDGAWLGLAGNQGVMLYATNSATCECNLGLDESGPVAWHPEMHEFATFGMFSHVSRWPIAVSSESQDCSIGPPSSVAISPVLARIGADVRIPQHSERHSAWHPDGRQLFYTDRRAGCLWKFDAASLRNDMFAEFASASLVAVSPDGTWIAATGWPSEQLCVWNAATHECVLDLPAAGRMAFSPDGRILAIGSRSDFRFFSTQTWESMRSWQAEALNKFHAAPIAFQPGGDLFAAAVSGHCVRLYNAGTGEPVADLPMREDADINWLSFSPDGARLAITRADRDVLIWNLHSLQDELHSVGLPIPSLPGTEQIAEQRQISTLDRGTNLESPSNWWLRHELLARHEALKQNYPDAIDRMDIALESASPQDVIVQAKLRMQRGKYHLLNNSPDAACADFRDAVKFNPAEPANARRFVELLLFGPPEVREPAEARRLLQDLVSLDEQNMQDRLNLILTDIHLHRMQAARNEFNQIDEETVAAASATARTAYRCVQIYIGRQSTAENVTVNPIDAESSLVEIQKLADEARETASLAESVILDEFCKLLEL